MGIETHHQNPEQVRQRLVDAGVSEQFVAGLSDKVAREVLEGVTRLFEAHKEIDHR